MILKTFAVCIFCSLVFASSVFAHDIWVEKAFVVLYGHVDKNRFDPFEPAKIKEVKGFDKKGKEVTVKLLTGFNRDGKEVPVKLVSSVEEVAAITLFFDGGYWVKTTDGWKNISKRDVKDYIESIHSIKFAKSLFGWNKRFSEPFGMRLEIVPTKNPFKLEEGEVLPVKVLFEGKPLEGATIKVNAYGKESATELVTNKEGMADVVIKEAGIQIITARHKVPLKDNPDADDLAFATALTFEAKLDE